MKIHELTDNVSRTFYHVTLYDNVKSILTQGLIPKSGTRSEVMGDHGIFMFPSIDDMNNALMNWLGEEYEEKYGEGVDLAALSITLPNNFPAAPTFTGDSSWEWSTQEPIPAKYIKFLSKE